MEIKRYKHNAGYSYTLGMALTIELIKYKRESVRTIYVHPDYIVQDKNRTIFDICERAALPCEVNGKIFSRLSMKENTYVIGVFEKYLTDLSREEPHIVLVNPGDSGNLGTILRTGLGFGFRDYAIIRPGVDIYAPKAIRASMGAFFHVRFSYFDSFDEYRTQFSGHEIYSFMLDGEMELRESGEKPIQPYSLIFGNEGTGLPCCFHNYGKSVCIAHNHEIDSLNLAIAFGIAARAFAELKN